ncbi:gluconate 2-dehydrogenase subunit 3 family protein [Vibrio porteresiae]|uniref:Gluconate 2-dehydrogenase subunit 3 family protein n=1 Tax=Vibrio porteresiae DSM 19223 TaxID=1123496 RepID=A0ABZ0QFZ7_9VIBR|nr:gluconate 2-dehydrogenase subunit 3 family protein [Vibrio porteresiae]WPC75416.1 gluconate 2-dehydrogenase subunit 3 family protein [Vibrio porteresiae DSM 19223]
MAFQRNITRRKFLMASVVALPMSQWILNGLSAAEATELAAPNLDDYKPSFFNAKEWLFILAATDQLIPAGGQGKAPGALETNVPVFIDQQLVDSEFGKEIYMQGPFHVDLPATKGYQIPFYPQQIYQTGIALTDKWCVQQMGKPFAELSAEQKQAVLTQLQKNEIDFAAFDEKALKASQFFSQLLDDTQHGYLADPMYGGNKGMKAWIALGFPGARASFTEWVKQHNIPYPLGPVSILGERA